MPKIERDKFEELEKNKKYLISSDSETNSDSSLDSCNSVKKSVSGSDEDNKIINVRKCKPKKILDCKIKNMHYSLRKILEAENKTKHIENLSRDNLITLKLIIKNIHALKNVNYVREKTLKSFQKCEKEIEGLSLATKKCDIKNALLKIGNLDNFESLKNILLGNRDISKLNQKIYRERSSLKRNKKYGTIRKY